MARKKRKSFPEFEAKIRNLSHEGKGIAEIDGKTVFIHGALPDETIRCQITYKSSKFNEAKILEIIEPSKDRVTPPCAHFGVCGGCSMQHMSVAHQLEHKQKVLIEQLKHFGKVTPEEILPAISGKDLGYRGKARLGVRYVQKKEKVLVGFREKHSKYLADIKSCKVLHKSVGNIIEDLSNLLITFAHYKEIPQIEVACSDDETVLIFRHLKPLQQDEIDALCKFATLNKLSIYLQPNPPEKIHKIFPKDNIESLSYNLKEFNLEMLFHPTMFTQVNSEINPLMISQALTLLNPTKDDEILDLFCGLGNFTLPLAKYAKNVVGIEGSKEMVKAATSNALHNNIENTEFYAANLFEPDRSHKWMQKKYNKILLDPPRSGAKEILPYLSEFNTKTIVYVSCNPATLARDANELVNNHGYKLKKTGIINMFPHTSHIEAMALFERA